MYQMTTMMIIILVLTKDDYKTRLVKNDTTGEAVFISFSRTSKYEYVDSTLMPDNKYLFLPGFDTTWIVRSDKKINFAKWNESDGADCF